MGLARFIAIKLANTLILLVIVSVIISGLFAPVMDQYARATIEEQIRAELQNPDLQRSFGGNSTAIQEYINQRRAQLYKQYELDKPLIYRIFKRAFDALLFKFGKSYSLQAPDGTRDINKLLLSRFPPTIILFTTATIITAILGIFLGLQAAKKHGSLFDKSLAVYSLFSYSIPTWWIGMIFILIFSFQLGLFPLGGMHSIPPPKDPLESFIDLLWHLALPLFTVVLVSFGGWAYVVRNIVIETITQDYIMVARAKGLPESRVMYHVLRAAAPPIVTMVILSILGSLGGAIITETVFNWPGMGVLYWQAITQNDLPVVIAEGYFFAFLYVIAMFFAELMYGLLDPRVRVQW